mgnify:CR=1 FL=1
MKTGKKVTAGMLSILLVGSMVIPVSAETIPSEKEEVIYVMMDNAGQVNDVEAVNIFSGGEITDYGDYSAVKMLNTTDKIMQNGDRISFSSAADRVYYQGTMKNANLPWNISIRYFLDGKEYEGKDLAGKSGKLEIKFKVEKNEKYNGDFYENYALQAAFSLDTDSCENIKADGATEANVGSKKQLTYTILPGKGIETSIYADVTDFSMEAVTINGVHLNLNIDIDDEELTDRINEIVKAVNTANNGASDIKDGTGKIADVTETLNNKVGELNSGVGALTSGAGELSSGLSAITEKNDQLRDGAYTAYEGLCNAAAVALNSQLSANGFSSVTLTPSTYSDVLIGLLKKMNADAAYNEAYQAALQKVTEQVNEKADKLYARYIQSQAESIYLAYITKQADTLYAKVAAQAVYEQLIQDGYTDEQANMYLQSEEGKQKVSQLVAGMSDEQKSQIISGAVAALTQEQKDQIQKGALNSLTDEQKSQIRETYIQQMMASDEVTAQINAAVAKISSAAEQVSTLKGQLDNYGTFYQGLIIYTDAVSNAASGADSLKLNMDKLYSSTGVLETSVGTLNDAVAKLYDGTTQLADGTNEFAEKTDGMDEQVGDEIDSMVSSISGNDEQTHSFISDKNTNVTSVQFVIKTEAIEKPGATINEGAKDETHLSFWQKLLKLFGL